MSKQSDTATSEHLKPLILSTNLAITSVSAVAGLSCTLPKQQQNLIIIFHVSPCRTFTWKNAFLGWLIYTIPGIFGITLCFHRMLTHRCVPRRCSKCSDLSKQL
jgi:fatty-acid desaturase